MSFKVFYSVVALLVILTVTSCQDDPKLPDNVVEFEADVAGISADESSLPIAINLSREASSDVTLNFTLETNGVVYGTDFTLIPTPAGNNISLTIPAGETQATMLLTKNPDALFDGDESITIALSAVGSNLVIGIKNHIVVNFSELVVPNATMDIQGGGPTFPNKVFIDLSANRQTAVARTNWDFGVYTGDGNFRVILNSSLSMLAKPTNKTDMNSVTAADTLGMKSTFTVDAFSTDNLPYIDAPTGEITSTAFAAVSTTVADNKVYIVNRGKNVNGAQRSWKKIRVLKNGLGYIIQYADINANTFQAVQVITDDSMLFNYVSIDQNAVVEVEPAKEKWDIAYTTFMNSTDFGGGFIPYMFNDMIIQNRNGVETAELLIANAGEYADFEAADLATVTFGTSQINIGSKWRTGGGPSSSPALKTDRFYVVKDATGNIYKLRFTTLTQNGERGKPSIEYALLLAAD